MSNSVRFTSLNAKTSTGVGTALEMHVARRSHSMQVILGGTVAATAVKVYLKASHDGGVTYGVIATFDTAAYSHVSGDIITVTGIPAENLVAELATLTGGTDPTVTAIIVSE